MVKITFEDSPLASAPASKSAQRTDEVTLTTAAANRIEEIRQRRKKKGEAFNFLRVRVDGGGCNGYSYKFLFEEAENADDIIIQKNGTSVLIDPISYNYLLGSSIDYVETLEASQFIIHNPNATSSCGCGNSFGM